MGTSAVPVTDGRTRAVVSQAGVAVVTTPVFDFVIGQGDTLPAIQAVLHDPLAAVVDLTTATSVQFVMVKDDDSVRVAAAATIVGAATLGTVQYAWAAADTAVFGLYEAQFVVTWPVGAQEAFPNNEPLAVQITRRA